MAKTQEELNTIKEEIRTLNKKLAELTEDELKMVCGGGGVATLTSMPGMIIAFSKDFSTIENVNGGEIGPGLLDFIGKEKCAIKQGQEYANSIGRIIKNDDNDAAIWFQRSIKEK